MKINFLFILKSLILLSASLFLTVSCKDQQALAEFDGGKVTRKELRTILSFRGESYIKQSTVQMQEQVLKNLALSKITAKEAQIENLDKDPDFIKRKAFFKEEAMVHAYFNFLKEKFKNKPFDMLSIQVFKLNHNGADRSSEAEMILKELNDSSKSDDEIADMIYHKSENPRYKSTGGYVDPLCISCTANNAAFITDPLKDEEPRKFIQIKDGSGIWIARKLNRKKVKPDDLKYELEKFYRKVQSFQKKKMSGLDDKSPEKAEIQKYFMTKEAIQTQSEQAADAQIQRESTGPAVRYIEEMKTKKKFTVYPPNHDDMLKGIPDSFILYSYKDVHFTYGDLKTKLNGNYGDQLNSHLNVLNGTIIPYELLKDEKEFQEITEDSFYDFISELQYNNVISMMYIKKKVEVKKISEEEILQWYQIRKLTEFKGKSLFAVKDQIRQTLINLKQQENFQNLQNELSKKYNLKINTDKLKAGEV